MKAATLLLLAAPGTLAAQYNPLNYGAFTDFLIPKPVLVARSSSPLERRDTTYNASITGTIIDQFYIIGNATEALTTAINEFSLATIFSLQASSLGLVGIINNAAKVVDAAPASTLTNAMDLQALTTVVFNLVQITNDSTTAAINQKEVFGGVSPVVLGSLQQLLSATTTFTVSVTKRLATNYASLAATASKPIFDSIKSGIAVFETPNVNPSYVYAATSMSGAATVIANRIAIGLGIASVGLVYLAL